MSLQIGGKADEDAGTLEEDPTTMRISNTLRRSPSPLAHQPQPAEHTSLALKYAPLKADEIRLVKLLPGSWEEPVSCQLEHHPLSNYPRYVALSYAWGDLAVEIPVTVNGQSHIVASGLFTALRRIRALVYHTDAAADGFTSCFRDSIDPFYVWADSLCLNQNDEKEKEGQIPRMGEIYGRAARVIGWLGENEDQEDSQCQLLMELCQVDPNGEQDPWWGRDYQNQLFDLIASREYDLVDILHSLLVRPFFQRLWIIQEMSLPGKQPVMLAGRYWWDMESLRRVWRFALSTRLINRHPGGFTTVHYHVDALVTTRDLYHDCPDAQNESDTTAVAYRLNRYLRAVQGTFQASRPHDQLYGLLGIACARNLPTNLLPNYEAPFEEVYKEYTKVLLQNCGDISILNRIDSRLRGVSSWVPDFRMHPWFLTHTPWPGLKFLPGDKLELEGVQLETCVTSWYPSDVHDYGDDGYDLPAHLKSLRDFFKVASNASHVPIDIIIGGWIDMCFKSTGSHDSSDAPDMRKMLCESVLAGEPLESEFWKSRAGELSFTLDASLIATERGMVDRVIRRDFGPEAGDVICAIQGSEYPVVLRPKWDDEFTFHGMCHRWDGAELVKYDRTYTEGKKIRSFEIV